MYRTKRYACRAGVLLATVALAASVVATDAMGTTAEEYREQGLVKTSLKADYPDQVSCPKIEKMFGVYDSWAPYAQIHGGIDVSGNIGTKIRAIADGTLLGFYEHRETQMLFIQHSPTETGLGKWIYSIYQHQSRNYPQNLKIDKKVKKGQIIAYMRDTGTSHPHLHLEIWSADNELYGFYEHPKGRAIGVSNKRWIDPLLVMAGTLDVNEIPGKKVKIPYDPEKSKIVWPLECR